MLQLFSNGFIRASQLKAITGLSTTTIWRLEKNGEFPKRRKISRGAVGWVKSEVEEWASSRQNAWGFFLMQ